MITFIKAERRQARLKIAFTGPSGSGKTLSSLLIASGIGGKVAYIDTENASSSIYADRFDFDSTIIAPPYTIAKYIEAIKMAESAKYDILIIDSISHAWAGEGGLLSKKEALDARGGNSFVNWGGITKEHEQFKAMLLNCNIHLICTMRSKQDYVLEVNDKGKSAPVKVGLAPIQREGMEYEFTTVLDLGMDHNAKTSKDRTSLFDGQLFKPTKETGEILSKWLLEGKVIDVPPPDTGSAQSYISDASGVSCPYCHAELILHKSKSVYICPNAKEKGDSHLRFWVRELPDYKKAAVFQKAVDDMKKEVEKVTAKQDENNHT